MICVDPSLNPQIQDYDASYNANVLPIINDNFDFVIPLDGSTNYVQTSLTAEIKCPNTSTSAKQIQK